MAELKSGTVIGYLPRRSVVHTHTHTKARSPSSFLLLVAVPGAPSSVLVPSSEARSP